MDRRVAGIFAVALIVVSIAIGLASMFPYFQRVGSIVKKNKDEEEENFRTLYVVLGSVVILIQIGIAVAIILGAFKGNKQS